ATPDEGLGGLAEVVGRVTMMPSGADFGVQPGESIMAAAERSGLRWPTICGGHASCGVCAYQVLNGGEDLAAAAPIELELTSGLPQSPRGPTRLACQSVFTRSGAHLSGFKRGVRPRGTDLP
ncbi:MAG: (2Fe-2S)-binding protein, partial [Pseudonocardiales bacterium]|nr:(2Fe-2S)-binding protein [Pseudonocardiales bacterium]